MIDITDNNSDKNNIISDLLPDLTPLLDVMFMLIVFLILTTNAVQQIFEVKLPEDQENVTKLLQEDDTLKITLFAEENKWAIDQQEFQDFKLFKHQLAKQKLNISEQRVIIFSDQQASVERLLQLLTYMQAQGIEIADIIME